MESRPSSIANDLDFLASPHDDGLTSSVEENEGGSICPQEIEILDHPEFQGQLSEGLDQSHSNTSDTSLYGTPPTDFAMTEKSFS